MKNNFNSAPSSSDGLQVLKDSFNKELAELKIKLQSDVKNEYLSSLEELEEQFKASEEKALKKYNEDVEFAKTLGPDLESTYLNSAREDYERVLRIHKKLLDGFIKKFKPL